MANRLKLQINGDGVFPDTVDLGDLIDVLRHVRSAVRSTAVTFGAAPSELRLSLKSVNRGSVRLELAADDRTASCYDYVVRAVATEDASTIPARAQESILALGRKVKARGWNLELVGLEHRAAIRSDREPFSALITSGATSLLVHLIRVGGEGERTATIKLPDGTKLTADVASETLAKQLGERLYSTFEAMGQADWMSTSHRLVRFRITGIGSYDQSAADPVAAIRELSRLAGDRWDGINPDDYVRELRAD